MSNLNNSEESESRLIVEAVDLLKRYQSTHIDQSFRKRQCIEAMKADREGLQRRSTELDHQIKLLERAKTPVLMDLNELVADLCDKKATEVEIGRLVDKGVVVLNSRSIIARIIGEKVCAKLTRQDFNGMLKTAEDVINCFPSVNNTDSSMFRSVDNLHSSQNGRWMAVKQAFGEPGNYFYKIND